MPRRWLSGVILFSFGFGCASLVKLPTAVSVGASGGLRSTVMLS